MTTPAIPAPDDFPINSSDASTTQPVEEQTHVDSDDASRRSHYAILVDASGLPEEAGSQRRGLNGEWLVQALRY